MTTPTQGRQLAAWARMLADGTRATVCLALLDGRPGRRRSWPGWPGVSRPTISEHLTLLVEGGLLREVGQGRHRYVELAGPETARLMEGLAALAPRRTEAVTSLKAASRRDALARTRTCCDHLAGRLGVAVTDSMTERELLDWSDGVTLTPAGQRWLADLGVTVERRRSRPLVRSCLDLTERRPHLAGAVGAALCRHVVNQGWVRRIAGDRALRITGSIASLGLPDDLAQELSARS